MKKGGNAMNQKTKRLLSVLLSACLICFAVLPAFASGDPNVYVSEGVYIDGDENPNPFSTTVTFDPETGRLTIDEAKGNIISIEDKEDFCNWIKTIASGVKTVYITKDSIISHFSNDQGLASYPFNKAFAYLTNLERFELEKGNEELIVKDGVLYSQVFFTLVHYPAAKPDKTYKIDDFCSGGLEPYAFCNTKYLEKLEFPSSRSSLTLFDFEEYSLSAVDLETLEPQESSIKQIVFYADEETFDYMVHFREGNNVADQAEVICEKPSASQSFLDYFRVTIPMYFIRLFSQIRFFFRALAGR